MPRTDWDRLCGGFLVAELWRVVWFLIELRGGVESGYIVVLTTVGSEEQGEKLARSIVGAGLAACVQIQGIRSVYKWKGEVCAEPEFLLMIKTVERQYASLERHIKANHSYETPEIIKLPIAGGSREYLAWIDECAG